MPISRLHDGKEQWRDLRARRVAGTVVGVALFCSIQASALMPSSQDARQGDLVKENSAYDGQLSDGSHRDDSFTVMGYFVNVTQKGEHAYGYSLQLWRHDNEIVGLFSSTQGLAGDPPTGVLQDVRFDHHSGDLSFQTKLSAGRVYTKEHTGVSSGEVYKFKGNLSRNRIVGLLEVSNDLVPQSSFRRRKLVLKRSATLTASMQEYQDYVTWKQFANDILKRLGNEPQPRE